jgi:hypothetical protein
MTALAIVVLGWVLLMRLLPRWTPGWPLQFFTLFAYLASAVPMLGIFLNRTLLPQPGRYKFEMEMALALLAVFWARFWIEKTPRSVRASLLFLFLSLAAEQIVSHRTYAKNITHPSDLAKTIEYRAAAWANQNLPDQRILLPGTIAQWANDFTSIQQFSGSSWSTAYNPIQQLGFDAAFGGGDTAEQDARVSLAWLKAFGVGAVCVSGPKSPEYWKPYKSPTKFEGVLPVLWREDDTTIYQIPQRSASFSHVVPETAVVAYAPRGWGDVAAIQRYVSALDDPSLPAADFSWEGRNRIHIRTNLSAGQAITVQVSYHPGWHARVGNRRLKVQKDGLGLMWLIPECNGECDIELDYDGGWELRICRWLSYLAFAGGLICLVLSSIRSELRKRRESEAS